MNIERGEYYIFCTRDVVGDLSNALDNCFKESSLRRLSFIQFIQKISMSLFTSSIVTKTLNIYSIFMSRFGAKSAVIVGYAAIARITGNDRSSHWRACSYSKAAQLNTASNVKCCDCETKQKGFLIRVRCFHCD